MPGWSGRSAALAAALRRGGWRRATRVASWLPKTRMTCLLPLAAARAGLVHVPVNPLLKRAQVAHILADSGAGLLVSGAARLATLEPGDVPDGCATIGEAEGAALFEHEDGAAAVRRRDPDDLAALLYTSGSTGRPKGVMLSHANMWLGAVSVAALSAARARTTGARGAAAQLRLWPEPAALDLGRGRLAWSRSTISPPRDVIRAVERHRHHHLGGRSAALGAAGRGALAGRGRAWRCAG